MNPGVEAVRTLADMGYRFQVIGEVLRYEWQGAGKPDPDMVKPLFKRVKEHKPDVLAYLSKPIPPERILTCFECPHFRPALSPAPTQAFGHCEKRKKGRYGVATACEAIMNTPDAPGEMIQPS